MERLQVLTQSVLVDMLAEYTNKYTRMRTEGASQEDYNNCLQTIDLLTKEIESRKKSGHPKNEVIDNRPETIFFNE